MNTVLLLQIAIIILVSMMLQKFSLSLGAPYLLALLTLGLPTLAACQQARRRIPTSPASAAVPIPTTPIPTKGRTTFWNS